LSHYLSVRQRTNESSSGTLPLKNGFISAGNAFLTFASQSLSHHPKRVTALLAALMLGGGGGAFAVASFAPDPADLPVRQVQETVQPLAMNISMEALEAQAFNLYRSEVTRSSDTADTLLKRLGVDDDAAAAFLRSDAPSRGALLGRSGRNVTAETGERNTLVKLTARWSPDDDGNFNRLVIQKTAQGFESKIEIAPLTATTQLTSGTIQSSLFAATDDAGIPDAIAVQVAEIFSSDIDFHRALRKGDRFSIVYETLKGDGESLRTGRVLSAEFVNDGKTFQAMWFQDPVAASGVATAGAATPAKGGYYTLDGQSLRRAFLASPLEFSRVTSGFKTRFHPILKKWKAHLGVDYAASTGTPVRTVGDGTVEFAGVQNGFGNVVFVKHRNNQTTVYAHLSRLYVRKGQSVSQGQKIAASGSSGWSTGPHLHFEFRVDGKQHDPVTIARQSDTIPLSSAAKPAFAKLAETNRIALAAAATVHQTSVE
jgi:murein DD-endopeptidase MepM/ murein hydrolase activator NlpD